MSEETEEKPTNRDIMALQYSRILMDQYPNLPPDIIEDATYGALLKLNAGGEPSSPLLAAAHDLDVHPTRESIITFLYKDRK